MPPFNSIAFVTLPSRRRKPAGADDDPLAFRATVILLATFLHTLTAQNALAEDTVWLRSTGTSERIFARKGTIKDYTGEALTFTVGAPIQAERVVRIDSAWTPQQQAGDAALANGDFAKALAAYQVAGKDEKRQWVRRMILASIVRCHRGEGRLDVAALAFLGLTRLDPNTRDFDAIPLLWFTSANLRTDTTVAGKWLRSPDPVARLIGASHLLASPARGNALATLEALSILPDTRVALLAQAQIWNTRLATSRPHEPERWAKAVEKLPETLRAGPSFIVARAFVQHKQPRRAAEHYMRVPILHSKQYHLAAQSLWEAAEVFAKLGRTKDGQRCLREIVKDYSHSEVAESAASQLRRAAEPKPSAP